jgi:hypothetical protein
MTQTTHLDKALDAVAKLAPQDNKPVASLPPEAHAALAAELKALQDEAEKQRVQSANRFFSLMEQFVNQVSDDVMREHLEAALDRMKLIHAE